MVLVAGREKEIERRGVTVNGDNGCWGVRGEAVMELLSHAWGHGAAHTPHTLVGDVSAGRNLTCTFCQRHVQECSGLSEHSSCQNSHFISVGTVLRRPGIEESQGFQQRLGRHSKVKLTACCGNIRAGRKFPPHAVFHLLVCIQIVCPILVMATLVAFAKDTWKKFLGETFGIGR